MIPMLAATVSKISEIENYFPLMASPKLDGIRALVIDGVVVSRNLKPIPNKYVQHRFGWLPHCFDGELIVGHPTDKDCFRNTTSGVMTEDGTPFVKFHVFDMPAEYSFSERFAEMKAHVKKIGAGIPDLKFVPHKLVKNTEQLLAYETEMLEKGYEGVMLRSIDGPYKHGRSTLKEGYLMKLKRFEDSEATILDVRELDHNLNAQTEDNLGRAKRSSHKAGKVGAGMMGAITVKDYKTGVVFDIGTGFTEADRIAFWKDQTKLLGAVVKYKYFPSGSKDKPRFPVFLGFRSDL